MSDRPQTPGSEADPMQERPTPQVVKSEAAILGAILRDNTLYKLAAERLEPSSFCGRNNGTLWAILPDLLAQAGGKGVDANTLASMHRGGRLSGFEKDDKDEIRAWLLDLERNRWTGSMPEHIEAVAEAGWHRRIVNKACKGRTAPYQQRPGDCTRTP